MAKENLEQEFMLPVTEEEYETAGSKFITFTDKNGDVIPTAKWKDFVGELNYRDVELSMPDWDTPGKSLKFPLTIVEEGPDKNKEDKISTGVDTKSIWKLKEISQAVLGHDLEMKAGADKKKHPNLKPSEYVGKAAVGVWEMMVGKKGGKEDAGLTYYPKLTQLLSAGSKPSEESLV